MKRQILAGLFLLSIFCAASVFAQKNKKQKRDFSGTWVLDESKSRDLEKELFKSSKKSVDSNDKILQQLVIEHQDPEIILTETAATEIYDADGKLIEKKEKVFPGQKFFTDKRAEENTNDEDKTYKSVTAWNEKEILIFINDGKKQTSVTKLSLSKDGGELTITRSFFTKNDSLIRQNYFIGLPLGGKKVFKKVSE